MTCDILRRAGESINFSSWISPVDCQLRLKVWWESSHSVISKHIPSCSFMFNGLSLSFWESGSPLCSWRARYVAEAFKTAERIA
jgi:hypothetical protein